MAFSSTSDTAVGNKVFSAAVGGNTGDTITLIGAGTGNHQAIHTISLHAAGTITAFTLNITKNDGSTVIHKIGGQVGGAATGPLGPYVWDFSRPIICVKGDNAKIIVTVTGATAGTVHIGVGYDLLNG